MADYKVAIERISKLLLESELDQPPVDGHDNEYAIKIEHGEFVWETEDSAETSTLAPNDEKKGRVSPEVQEHVDSHVNATIHDINLKIKHGALVAVIGRVGSGKSSLLQSIIGGRGVSEFLMCIFRNEAARRKPSQRHGNYCLCTSKGLDPKRYHQEQYFVWCSRGPPEIHFCYPRLLSRA